MNIVHIIPTITISAGGGDRACVELAESQAHLGHEVIILHTTALGVEELPLNSVRSVRCETDDNFLGHTIGLSRSFEFELMRLVAKADILHIHALWRYINVITMKVARQNDVPYVLQPHGSLHPWKLRHKWLVKKIWGYFFERRVIKNACALHAESERDKKDIIKYCSHQNVFIAPCGSFIQKVRIANPKPLEKIWPQCRDKKIILFLGRVDSNKGIDLLIHALASLRKKMASYHTLIIGPDFNNTTQKMMDLIRVKGLEESVTFTGLVSEEYKQLALDQSDLFILPSLSENFGISVLEALFSKLPVITTTETAWECLSSINGAIIVSPNKKALTDGLSKFLDLSDYEKRSIAQNGYEYVRNRFDWGTIADFTINEYEKIISTKTL